MHHHSDNEVSLMTPEDVLFDLAGGRSLQQDKPADLLSEARDILGQAAGSVEAGIHSLVDGLFGPANSFFTQIPSDIQNLCKLNPPHAPCQLLYASEDL